MLINFPKIFHSIHDKTVTWQNQRYQWIKKFPVDGLLLHQGSSISETNFGKRKAAIRSSSSCIIRGCATDTFLGIEKIIFKFIWINWSGILEISQTTICVYLRDTRKIQEILSTIQSYKFLWAASKCSLDDIQTILLWSNLLKAQTKCIRNKYLTQCIFLFPILTITLNDINNVVTANGGCVCCPVWHNFNGTENNIKQRSICSPLIVKQFSPIIARQND